jgi:ferredoxin-NADP reductase
MAALADAPSSLSVAGPQRPAGPAARRSITLEPNATLVDRHDLTATIMRLRVRADDGVPTYRAGQYFAIGLELEGRFIQRPYSTASAPGELGDLEFLVRLVPGGSLTPSLWRLQPGDRVRIGPPKGLFMLDADDPTQHLFLATGTGIAPLLSMLGSLLGRPRTPAVDDEGAGRPIVIHGVASVAELVYRERFERLARDGAIDYVPAISRPADPANAGWRGHTGRLDALVGTIAQRSWLDPAGIVAYLCGNPAMIAAVEPRLAALGLASNAIRAEQYWTTDDSRPSADGTRAG